MKSSGFRIGPGMASLLMILVTLLMAALAVLAMTGAKNDAALSARGHESVMRYYEAAAQMQREIADIDLRLFHSRMEAMGDAEAYEEDVLELADEYPDFSGDGSEERLRLRVPMDDDFYLEAVLEVPITVYGLRYRILSHAVVDEAPWEDAMEFDLFPF